ncbi:TrkA family potassium uptake protein, partial [Candidatus Woesearchaeota archaeon]
MEKERIFAVFGLGTFGIEVCKGLSARGAKIIAVDSSQKVTEKVKNYVTQAVLLDSTDEDALRSAGLQDVDVAVIAMGDNIDSSVLTTSLLKNMGVPRIIARAMSD